MGAMHFLQEHQLGGQGAHRIAQLRQDEAPVEHIEALVGIDGQQPQPVHRRPLAVAQRFGTHDRASNWPGAYSSRSASPSRSSRARAS
ncbi:hypothetical protein D3C77_629690 [compost metagenome]